MPPIITLIITIAGDTRSASAPLAIDLAGVFRGSSWGPGAFLDPDKLNDAFADAPPPWRAILADNADFIAEAINTAINEADCRYELSRDLGSWCDDNHDEHAVHVAWNSWGIDRALDAIQGAR